MSDILGIGGTVAWLSAGLVQRGAVVERLTPLEARLLTYLSRHSERHVTAEELLAEVWGVRPDLRTHTVATIVHRLRHKIEPDPRRPRHLRTRRGSGYRLVDARPLQDPVVEAGGLVGAVQTAEALGPVATEASDALCAALLEGALGPLDAPTQSFVHGRVALHGHWRGDRAAVAGALEAGWRVLREPSTSPWSRRVAHRLHLVQSMEEPDPRRRRRAIERATALVPDQPFAQAIGWLHLAWLQWAQGDASADDTATRAAARFAATGDHRLVAQTRAYQALYAWAAGDLDRTRERARSGVDVRLGPDTHGWVWVTARLLAAAGETPPTIEAPSTAVRPAYERLVRTFGG